MSYHGELFIGFHVKPDKKLLIEEDDGIYPSLCQCRCQKEKTFCFDKINFRSLNDFSNYIERKLNAKCETYRTGEKTNKYCCSISIKLNENKYGEIPYSSSKIDERLNDLKNKLIEFGFKVGKPVIGIF